MKNILVDLINLNRVFCSTDYDKAIKYLCNILPFRVYEFPAVNIHNGWVIPPKWDVKKAQILNDGEIIYDATQHPLSVIALSRPFHGTVKLDELKKHLHFDTRFDDAIPYHFRQMYRSWERDWGFCVTKKFYDSLGEGEYEVTIETNESEGVLKALEYTKKGILDETIIFAAHLDHPGMANDDLVGCAVGVELFKRLLNRNTKFSYQLFIHQEVICPEYYLANLPENKRRNLREGVFIEMLGSNTPIGLQSAPQGMTLIEHFIKKEMDSQGISYRHEPYGGVVVNGEYIYAGYGIPISSFSRYPYPEYHTDKDNLSIIYDKELNESLDILLNAIERLENDIIVRKKYTGTVCTSNPDYDLYVDPGQAAFGGFVSDSTQKSLRKFMELFSMYNNPVPLEFLADTYSIEQSLLYDYLVKWKTKGLIELL
jgi:aminopeptidase-like protein